MVSPLCSFLTLDLGALHSDWFRLHAKGHGGEIGLEIVHAHIVILLC